MGKWRERLNSGVLSKNLCCQMQQPLCTYLAPLGTENLLPSAFNTNSSQSTHVTPPDSSATVCNTFAMFTKNIAIAALLAASPLLSCAYDYGVDVSFPIHHDFFGPEASISKTMQTFGPQKVDLYQEYISGCKKYYGPGNTCDMNEASRMEHNRDQPKAMTNYTEVGFKKIRLSDVTWRFIREFWEDQIAQGGIEALPDEVWPEANTYKNNW